MVLIIGLGNPGRRYKRTRHNIGFRILDQFCQDHGLPGFRLQKKFQAEISQGLIENEQVILAKPQTFMNDSGRAVKAIVNFYKLALTDLIVVHDDLDLVLGDFKVSENRGSAGHKGVESIIGELASQDFSRLRLGIKSFEDRSQGSVKEFVLQKFSRDEEKIVKQIVKKAGQTLLEIAFGR